ISNLQFPISNFTVAVPGPDRAAALRLAARPAAERTGQAAAQLRVHLAPVPRRLARPPAPAHSPEPRAEPPPVPARARPMDPRPVREAQRRPPALPHADPCVESGNRSVIDRLAPARDIPVTAADTRD